jgi:hypothetical protein
MKERPIIFSTDMVKAILAGTKTMTRRVIKKPMALPPDDKLIPELRKTAQEIMATWCPYGQVGDRLWVRETWATYGSYDRYKPSQLQNIFLEFKQSEPNIFYKSSEEYPHRFRWRSSRFMPRWASRILLEITDIRVERLQEITEADAIAEGIVGVPTAFGLLYKPAFSRLWDSLNAKRGYGWEVNPWVWAVSFKRLR